VRLTKLGFTFKMVNEVFKPTKRKTILILFIAALVISAISYISCVNAQNQATVNVLESVGGSTEPAPGTYNYNDGTQVTLTATPDANLVFSAWLITTDTSNDSVTDNPYMLPVTGGVTYEISAVFAQSTSPTFPNPPPTSLPPSAFGSVTILSALGGRTTRATGTYYFTSIYRLELTAVADSGWKFSHWVISGDTDTTHGGYPFTLTPTDNPYTFDCGLGYTYAYQPVFTPEGSNPPTNPPPASTGLGISTELLIAIVAIIIAVIIAIASIIYVQRSKK
jgi:hypothetical protein